MAYSGGLRDFRDKYKRYICLKNGSDEEKLLKSLSGGGGNSLCEGLALYLSKEGGQLIFYKILPPP